MQTDPASLDPEERLNKFYAIASAALGVLSLCLGVIPVLGTVLGVLGIILGIFGRRSENKKAATVGIGLCAIGILTAIIFSILVYVERFEGNGFDSLPPLLLCFSSLINIFY